MNGRRSGAERMNDRDRQTRPLMVNREVKLVNWAES